MGLTFQAFEVSTAWMVFPGIKQCQLARHFLVYKDGFLFFGGKHDPKKTFQAHDVLYLDI